MDLNLGKEPDRQPRKVVRKKQLTLEQVARQCYEQAGDYDQATTLMVEQVNADDDLFRALFNPSRVRAACYDIVRYIVRSMRADVWNTPQPTDEEARAAISALADVTVGTLMQFPLWPGKRLATATREEVLKSATKFIKHGTTTLVQGRWLQIVGMQMSDGATAEECFTEKELGKFKKQAEKKYGANI
jgi:hypothetical protein